MDSTSLPAKSSSRKIRFGLRTLLAITSLIAISVGLLVNHRNRYLRARETLQNVEATDVFGLTFAEHSYFWPLSLWDLKYPVLAELNFSPLLDLPEIRLGPEALAALSIQDKLSKFVAYADSNVRMDEAFVRHLPVNNLQSIEIHDYELPSNFFHQLAGASKLTKIVLWNCNISADAMSRLVELPNLEEIWFRKCRFADGSSIVQLSKGMQLNFVLLHGQGIDPQSALKLKQQLLERKIEIQIEAAQ